MKNNIQIWYKARKTFGTIRKVKISRATECFIYLHDEFCQTERREAKNSTFYSYHDTWEGARLSLIQDKNREIDRLEKQLQIKKQEREKIRRLKR